MILLSIIAKLLDHPKKRIFAKSYLTICLIKAWSYMAAKKCSLVASLNRDDEGGRKKAFFQLLNSGSMLFLCAPAPPPAITQRACF